VPGLPAPAAPHSAAAAAPPAAAERVGMLSDRPAAVKVTAPQVQVCKYYINTGRCAKGADCPYLHTLTSAALWAPSRHTWVQNRCAKLGYSVQL